MMRVVDLGLVAAFNGRPEVDDQGQTARLLPPRSGGIDVALDEGGGLTGHGALVLMEGTPPLDPKGATGAGSR